MSTEGSVENDSGLRILEMGGLVGGQCSIQFLHPRMALGIREGYIMTGMSAAITLVGVYRLLVYGTIDTPAHRLKTLFISLLTLGNFSRAVFLAVLVTIETFDDWYLSDMWGGVGWTFPVAVFYTAMTAVVAYWSSLLLRANWLSYTLVVLNLLLYASLVILASVEFTSEACSSYCSDIMLLIVSACEFSGALISCLVGFQLIEKLAPATSSNRHHDVISRVTLMCSTCFFVLCFRGVVSLLLGMELQQVFLGLQPSLWHILILTLSEWVPSLVLLHAVCGPSKDPIHPVPIYSTIPGMIVDDFEYFSQAPLVSCDQMP